MRKEVLTNKEYKKFLGDLHKLANKHGLSISHLDLINPPEGEDYSDFEMYEMWSLEQRAEVNAVLEWDKILAAELNAAQEQNGKDCQKARENGKQLQQCLVCRAVFLWMDFQMHHNAGGMRNFVVKND